MDQNKKFLLESAERINNTAQMVYGAIQGGKKLNFFNCNAEYNNGRYGWIKENTSFETAIEIYEEYTSNEGWDVVEEIREEFPEIDTHEYSDLIKLFDTAKG